MNKQIRDVLCFSHLRWNFVYQRPQHLLSRLSNSSRIFFFEEPVFHTGENGYQHVFHQPNVHVIIPTLNSGSPNEVIDAQRNIVHTVIKEFVVQEFISWYYTPMAMSFTDDLHPQLCIYDCMDELSAFLFAPPEMKEREQQLLNKAGLIFTGGLSLYESRKEKFPEKTFMFPSSIDVPHFHRARSEKHLNNDHTMPHPRIGFCGVIDERLDIILLKEMAMLKPDWSFVMLGPVVKIDPDSLPKEPNIYYTGAKSYAELPAYFAQWDAAMMPFAINEATRYISPTKTPEYLAAGLPVVSTFITDVVRTYANDQLVRFADSPAQFVKRIEEVLPLKDDPAWLRKVDEKLSGNSWNLTVDRMKNLIEEKLNITVAPQVFTNPMQAIHV